MVTTLFSDTETAHGPSNISGIPGAAGLGSTVVVHWTNNDLIVSDFFSTTTIFYLFHKNHQATDTKIDNLTIIVLKSADPYLPDRVEFKHTSLLNLRQDNYSVK